MTRRTVDVIALLLEEKARLVTEYGALGKTAEAVDALIGGTAVFPGGAGVWRGREPFGALPAFFPERPVMFVAHNFDSVRGHERSRKRGIEPLDGAFWKYLLAYLAGAGIPPETCFFTNVLMGLQPEKATGAMHGASAAFRAQCRAFMLRQIAIVRPRAIAVLGQEAQAEMHLLECGCAPVTLLHPSALRYRPESERAGIVREQAARLSGV